MFSNLRAEASELISFSLSVRSLIVENLWWRSSLGCRNLAVHDDGQVSFCHEHCILVRPVEIRAIDASTQVGQKHAAAFPIQGDTDSFHQMVENNLRFFRAISLRRIHGRSVYCVPAGSVAAICPVDRPVGEVEFEIDRFGKILIQKFDIFAVCWSLTLRNFEIGAKEASLTGFVRALLSPIKF